MCVGLLFAGYETSVNAIGNTVWALLTHPAEFAELSKAPHLRRAAIEELLRFEAPVQMMARVTSSGVELGGQVLEPESPVVALIGSANRDPDVFSSPNSLDWSRPQNPHLSFSTGIHHCLGASVARLHLDVVLDLMIDGTLTGALADAPTWSGSLFLRGPRQLVLIRS